MTEAEIKEDVENWLKDNPAYNVWDEELEEFKAGVKIAIDRIVTTSMLDPNLQSEKHRHMSKTFIANKIDNVTLSLLSPYRQMVW